MSGPISVFRLRSIMRAALRVAGATLYILPGVGALPFHGQAPPWYW